MIEPKNFINSLKSLGVDFYTGVPDSLLKDICAYITTTTTKSSNIIAANEGGAMGIAVGHYLATGNIPMVYMQNSGLGNIVNPLMSLTDPEVYSIPVLLLIGWRGEPGVKDEPQHIKQGKTTLPLLDAMNIPYAVLSDAETEATAQIKEAIDWMKSKNSPYALIIRKGTFCSYTLTQTDNKEFELSREQAIEIVLDSLPADSVVISTTGMISRELFELREKRGQNHSMDFLTVGSMGHASQIALGIALSQPHRPVYCFDGDGATLMHMGGLAIIGAQQPANYTHIVFNNGAHDSVGGQPTVALDVDLATIAKGCGYGNIHVAKSSSQLREVISLALGQPGSNFVEILVRKGARKDLGRPTSTPIENKKALMKHLQQ